MSANPYEPPNRSNESTVLRTLFQSLARVIVFIAGLSSLAMTALMAAIVFQALYGEMAVSDEVVRYIATGVCVALGVLQLIGAGSLFRSALRRGDR